MATPSAIDGRGVRTAVENVMQVIAPAVHGMEAGDQEALDASLA